MVHLSLRAEYITHSGHKNSLNAHIRHYDLVIRSQLTSELQNSKDLGPASSVMTINGSIPGPVLVFEEGELAEIKVRNEMAVETSIHWHGLLLPFDQDGVPYVNSPPIKPGTDWTFKFPLRQAGTYWYHSHTHLQEQSGLYGAIKILPQKSSHTDNTHELRDEVVLLSDYNSESPEQTLKNLRKDGDFYLYKKGTIRSYSEALSLGKLKNQLQNEWTRMGGMDLSDVGYDAFLANGTRVHRINSVGSKKVRLRIINGSSSTYFVLKSPIPFRLIEADGRPVEPLISQYMLIAVAETYDIEFQTLDRDIGLIVSAQDGTGETKIVIQRGEVVRDMLWASPIEKPDLYAIMDHASGEHKNHGSHGMQPAPQTTNHSNHSQHKSEHLVHGSEGSQNTNHTMLANEHAAHTQHTMHGNEHAAHTQHSMPSNEHETHTQGQSEKSVDVISVDQLKSTNAKTWNKADQEIKLTLNGDMRRYIWHLNGKVISQDRWLNVNEGDVIRIVFENKSMMHHPMHLHGHFFRVINNFGEFSPLKHTVDVAPHQTRIIEFKAEEPGRWMLHCHNLYHMTSGMGRVLRYQSFATTAEQDHLDHEDHHRHDSVFTKGQVELATNHAQFEYKWMKTWDEFVIRGELAEANSALDSYKVFENETDALYRRWIGNYTYVTAGMTSYHSHGHVAGGIGYIAPFLIHGELLAVSGENIRLRINRKFQWTKEWSSDIDWTWRPRWHGDRDNEYEITLMRSTAWSHSYGLMLTEKKIGVGIIYQF